MNNIVRDHLLTRFAEGIRFDGRKFDQFRKVSVEYDVSPRSAEGSARVKIGDTEVVAGVKVELGTPFPDKPNQGSIMVNVELLPFASPDFESGPPSIDSIEMSRVTDRVLRESGVIDFKKLCITAGEKVWLLLIDIYPINDAGNLYDAAYLAAISAIKNMKFPKVVDGKIQYGEASKSGLKLGEIPMSCTVLKIGDHLLVDPSKEEFDLLDARLTVGVMPDGKMCALQKGGEKTLNTEDLDKMLDMAIKSCGTLRKAFEK